MKLTNTAVPAALLFLIASAASGAVILTATASPNSAPLGGITTVKVTLKDNNSTNPVAGFQFDLGFNAAVLQETAITEQGYFLNNGFLGLNTVNVSNTNGTVASIADVAITPEDPGTGDPLVNIAFRVIGAGASPITFSNVTITDGQFNSLPVTATGTTFGQTSTPEPTTFLLVSAGLIFALVTARSARIRRAGAERPLNLF